MKTSPPWLVIDTNVLISAAILPNSVSAQLLRRASQHFQISQSRQTWQELVSRLERPKFDVYFERQGRSDFLTLLAKSVFMVEVSQTVQASRDPDDDKFLALALTCGAKHIVSGDNDLLSLGEFEGVDIMNASKFLTQICTSV